MCVELTIGFPEHPEFIVRAYHLYLQSIDRVGGELLPTVENAELFALDVLIPAWERKEPILFAAHAGRIVGATFTTLPDPRYRWRVPAAIGHGTWVVEDYRRKGVAGALLEEVRTMLRARGITRQMGMTHPGNAASIAAFEKLGFVPHGTVVHADL